MEALFRLAGAGSSVEQFAKDVHAKGQLTSHINGAVRALQHEYLVDNGFVRRIPGVPIILAETSSPAVVDLCNYLEAAMLHGLKEKLSISRVTKTVLGPRSPANFNESQYQLDFWPIILILCHNQVSDSLMKLSNITTDIGRCRAWLRQTLNEGLFASYLEALTNDTSLLHGFYRSSAYIRDRDHMDLLRSVMEELDQLQFQLNYDCSSLNSWSNETLKMIGVAVQMVPEPIMPGEDALDEVRRNEIKQNRQRRREQRLEQRSHASAVEESIISSSLQSSEADTAPSTCDTSDKESAADFDEDEFRQRPNAKKVAISDRQLRLIIKNDVPPTPDIVVTPSVTSPGSHFGDESCVTETPHKSDCSSIGGNSINRKLGWSSSPPVKINRDRADREIGREASYESVLNSYSTEVVLSSTPDIRDLNPATPLARITELSRRSMSMFDTRRPKPKQDKEVSYPSIGDFEVIPKSIVLNNAEPETHEFLIQFCRLGNEIGLDQQNYKCNSCGRPIGMIYGKSRTCKFDGFNYCVDCHINEEMTIPARVIHNWDFKKYPVAKRNKNLLSLTESEPLLDIKTSSPLLYKCIPELAEALDLRTQLFYLHAYIFTCQESVTFELRKLLWPKEHLFEHVHLYSCADLIQVTNGQLVLAMKKAIAFARKHVLGCALCSQKGFICEICKASKIIYPFDTKDNHRCDACKAVFHMNCFFDENGAKKDCPRCIRIERRNRAEQATD